MVVLIDFTVANSRPQAGAAAKAERILQVAGRIEKGLGSARNLVSAGKW
jgi:hypothetical protein